MTTTEVQSDEAVDAAADASDGSSGACLDIQLHANGRTEKIRLSGCTFGDAVHFCAPGLWQEYASGLERELANPAWQAQRYEPIDSVELVLYEDGSVQEIRLRGCTVAHLSLFRQIIGPMPPDTGGALELTQHVTVARD